MKIPFVGGHYKGYSQFNNPQETQNFWLGLDVVGGKEIAVLFGTPGLLAKNETMKNAEVRGSIVIGDYLYAVSGDTVYYIDSNYRATAMATTLDTSSGPIYMVTDGTYILITDGVAGYTVTGLEVTKITDASFPTPSSCAYLDGFFLASIANSDGIIPSALDDPTSWDATDIFYAESSGDNNTRVIVDHREVWIYGTKTIEVWILTSAGFERVRSAAIEVGTEAGATVTKASQTLWWYDQGFIYRANGYQPQIVSSEQFSAQVKNFSTTSDAIAYSYKKMGHEFYVLTFPTENKTFMLDTETLIPVTLASFPNDGRHRSNCYAKFNGKNVVGDFENGKLYELDLNTYTDNGNVLRSIRIAQPGHSDRKKLAIPYLEVLFHNGVGIVSGQGSDPQAIMQFSRNGGRTYGNEKWRTMGKIGEYTSRAVWRQNGAARDWAFKLVITDPVFRGVISAHMDVVRSR